METLELAEALVAWAVETLPELQGAYDHPPETRDQAPPDVAATVGEFRDMPADPNFPWLQAQQQDVRVHACELLLVVPPEPVQDATHQLYGFCDRLADAVRTDPTLGGRVPEAARQVVASFNPPFVEFDDGTTGRAATFQLAVAQPLEVSA